MRIIKKIRKHFCVYWGPPVNTGEEHRFPLPVECRCRWDNRGYVIRLRKGGEYVSQTTVLIDRMTMEDGFLWLGKLEELQLKYPKTFADPRHVPEAKVIKKTETLGTLRSTDFTNMNKIAHWAYL